MQPIGLIVQRYWPLEQQPFFNSICRNLSRHNARQLRSALSEEWSGHSCTVDLTDNLIFNVSYRKETSNQPSTNGDATGRRNCVDLSWWANDDQHKTTITMIANEVDRNLDSLAINLAVKTPEIQRQSLIGETLNRLVELPKPFTIMGQYVIVEWTKYNAEQSAALLKQ